MGHRGNAAHAPENTIESFRQAVAIGVDALELDVHLSTDGHVVVVVGPLHARILSRGGLTRADVQAELYQRAVRTTADLERAGRLPRGGGSEQERRHVVPSPDHVVVTVAGGHLYGYSAVVPPWVAGPDSLPVTEPVPV